MGASGEKKVSIDGQELELDYPCQWTYTVFAADEDLARKAVQSIVGGAEYSLELSHKSKAGKYRSLHLVVTVRDNAQRLDVFKQLHDHADVTYVL